MVILKKIKASTLVETITASVIIIIVFAIASLTLNNIFASTIKHNTNQLENYLYTLEYQYINKKLTLPYHATFENWELSIVKFEENNLQWIVFKAVNSTTKKTVERKRIYVED